MSPDRFKTEWASRSDQVQRGFRLEQGQGLGAGVGPGDRRDDRGAVLAKDVAEVGVGGVLVEHRQGHRAVLGQGLDRLVAEGGVGEVVENHVGGVGAGLEQGSLAAFAELDGQPERGGASPHLVDQADGDDVAEVARDGLGGVAGEQFVDVGRVDPEEDQGLVERQRPAQGVEDRAVEFDQGEAVQARDPEGVEGDRAVLVQGPERGPEVGGAWFQANEGEQAQSVVEFVRLARPSGHQFGHADWVGQDQGEGVGVFGRDLSFGQAEAGDLGDHELAVGVVGPLEAEVIPPPQEDLGGRGVAEGIAEPPEVAGVLLIKINRFDPQGVEQGETSKAVGPLDRQGILAVRPINSADEFGLEGISSHEAGFEVGRERCWGRQARSIERVGRRGSARFEGQLAKNAQGGQEDDGG